MVRLLFSSIKRQRDRWTGKMDRKCRAQTFNLEKMLIVMNVSANRIVIGSMAWERAAQTDFFAAKIIFLYLIFILIIRLLKAQSLLPCVYVDGWSIQPSWALDQCSAQEKSTFGLYFPRISGVIYNGGSGFCFIWMRNHTLVTEWIDWWQH